MLKAAGAIGWERGEAEEPEWPGLTMQVTKIMLHIHFCPFSKDNELYTRLIPFSCVQISMRKSTRPPVYTLQLAIAIVLFFNGFNCISY